MQRLMDAISQGVPSTLREIVPLGKSFVRLSGGGTKEVGRLPGLEHSIGVLVSPRSPRNISVEAGPMSLSITSWDLDRLLGTVGQDEGSSHPF